ncbi:MAG: D-2-hydroxyacid dehydrogenase [Dehalococcoidales bacterium]|nr:D-2-hydroxyacid dehydrogenase [Dehalococcoidales bacterium]
MMKPINIVITPHLDKALLEQIKLVSPRLKVIDISGLAQLKMIDRFLTEPDNVRAKINKILADAEIIYGYRLPEHLIRRAPKLKWYQSMTAGIDWFVEDTLLNSKVIITTVGGIHSTVIPEFVMAQMLMLAKQAPELFELKHEKQWYRFMPIVLKGKTIGILGLGKIGCEIARMAKAFGMKVIAVRRSAKKGSHSKYANQVLPPSKTHRLLAESDFVVVALPLTRETTRIIGERELNAMKPSAYIINIARGAIIDQPALIRALEEQRIAGAALDVFDTEPLPTDNKLWEMPNVIISPHIAGAMPDYEQRATDVFCQNLARYIDGKRLINVVNKKRGY